MEISQVCQIFENDGGPESFNSSSSLIIQSVKTGRPGSVNKSQTSRFIERDCCKRRLILSALGVPLGIQRAGWQEMLRDTPRYLGTGLTTEGIAEWTDLPSCGSGYIAPRGTWKHRMSVSMK